MLALSREAFLQGRPLPDGLTRAEDELAAAALDMLQRSRHDRWAPGTLPLDPLPRG